MRQTDYLYDDDDDASFDFQTGISTNFTLGGGGAFLHTNWQPRAPEVGFLYKSEPPDLRRRFGPKGRESRLSSPLPAMLLRVSEADSRTIPQLPALRATKGDGVRMEWG